MSGTITVGDKGFDSQSQDYAQLISRSLALEGEVRANHLDVILGVNQVDDQLGRIKPQTATGAAPVLALDTKNVGGMYANRIRLVITEKDVAANLNNIVSHQGDITIDTVGDLTFGNVTAKKDLNVIGKKTTVAAGSQLRSGRDITLATTELNNFGQVKAERDMRLFSHQVRNTGPSAELYANNQMWIQKDAAGNKNALVENKSGSIKTGVGDLIIRTDKLENTRQVFNAEWRELTPDSTSAMIYAYDENHYPYKTVATFSKQQLHGEGPTGWFGIADFRTVHILGQWSLYKLNTERSLYEITAETPAATLYSGNNLYINSDQLTNNVSNVGAKKDIFLTGNDFLNRSHSNWVQDDIYDYEVRGVMRDENYGRITEWYAPWSEAEKYPAAITAGGNIVLDFNSRINLSTEIPESDNRFYTILELKELTQPILQGKNILLNANTITTNNELIHASGDITLIAEDNIYLNNSALRGRDVSLAALNDINGIHGEISGRDITLLSRQGNVEFKPIYDRAHYLQPDQQRIISQINATGDFTAMAGNDINLIDTLLHPAGNINLSASQDINITHSKDLIEPIHDRKIFTREQNIQLFNQLLTLPGKLKSRADININSGNSLSLKGITLDAGRDINLHSTHDIDLTARDISFISDNPATIEEYNYPHDDIYLFFPDSRTPELDTKISANGNILINAGRDILAQTTEITADNNMTLLAGQNIQLAAVPYPAVAPRRDRHRVTRLQAGGKLNAAANHQLLTYGAELASGHDMTLTSGNNMRFESLLNEEHQGGGDNFSYRKLQQPTQLSSGGALTLISNGSILFQATQLVAKSVMDIAAEGGYLFAQAMEETSHSEAHWTTRTWYGRKKSHHNVSHSSINKVTEFTAEGDISLLSRDDSTYQASKIAAGQNARLTSTHGKVIFDAVKDATFAQKTTLAKGFYIKQTDNGYQQGKWVLPAIYTGGELTVNAAQGISADVKARNNQSVQAAVNELAALPGNQWLKQLYLRDDVQWQKVMDAYHHWDHQSEHLNPVVAAVIGIGVAVATAGSGLVATANSAVGGGVAGGAVTGGISALASQAAVALVNNQGDLSQTFKDLGSQSSVKSLVTSMALGGALSGFDGLMGWESAADGATAAKLPRLSNGDWSKVAQRVAGQSIISSSLNTGINGGSFKDNLTVALLANIGGQLHAEGANLIGNNGAVLGAPGKAVSHAMMAGIAAEIGGGNAKGAAAGALAAELAGVVMGENFIGSQQWQEQQAQLSRIAGAVAGALATGKAEGVYSGADAAEVVERFNRQLHLAEIKAVNELAQDDRVKQERFLAASCRQVNCTAQASLNSAERMQAETLMAQYPNTPEEEGILTHYWIQKEKKRFGNYPALTGFEQIQLFTYTDADKLSDSQTFAKNQWIESASKATGWSKETIEALGLSISLVGLVRGQKRGGTKVAPNTFGITQSRINLMKGDKRAGWEHVVERHFSGKTNASQFSISQQELRAILQDKSSVQTPISRTIPSNESPRYERVIDVGKPIGFDKFSGGVSTSIMTVLTDKHGNLITATPGRIQ
ncbi:filamentous hemagglutinin outer membrane protein [Yersinia aleksiciae]|nr:filamentous hemagglutinin outer membrane protein [Yersinia aleksiciae]